VVYGLIATERVNRMVATLVGPDLVLLLRLVSAADAFPSEKSGIDRKVILLPRA